jgi:hypothetical protein
MPEPRKKIFIAQEEAREGMSEILAFPNLTATAREIRNIFRNYANN